MEIVRTEYFPQPSPLLPPWIPSGGLFVQILRSVLDNHFQDALGSVISPYLFPNFVYAARTGSSPPDTFAVSMRLGGAQWSVQVSLSRDKTDIYDRAEPFALYDGEWLLVFNLYHGSATGGVASSGSPHPLWTGDAVPGTLVALSDHFVGGRALWRVGSGAWRQAVLESRGLFLPASYTNVQCFYERRPPYPQATLPDGTPLQFRWTWSRGDDVLRMFANPRRVRSLASAFASVRGKLPGLPLFAIAAECGLVSLLPRVPLHQNVTLPPHTTAVYSTHDGSKILRRYPQTVSEFAASDSPYQTSLIVVQKAWLQKAEPLVRHTLTDEVS